MKKYCGIILLIFVSSFLSCSVFKSDDNSSNSNLTSPLDIAVNQLGYRIDDKKDFLIGRFVEGFQILNEQNEVVFNGRLSGPVHDDYAACNVWKGDFTDVKKPGKYIVKLTDGTHSYPFQVDDGIYTKLMQTALRGLYVSRCGYSVIDNAVGHPPCHMHDGEFMILNGEQIPDGRDATGGWHDGGDYYRSTMSAAQVVCRLLWPEELFPHTFDKIPSLLMPEEQYDNWPDLLTEARWGLEWLFKMQSSDGGVSIGIAPYPAQMPPMIPPQNDPMVQFIGAVHSSNTAKVGAVFAKAARILKSYNPQFAQNCLDHARLCWEYLQSHPQPVAPKTCATYVKIQDQDDRLWLAVELYRTTGEKTFHDDFLARFGQMDSSYPHAPVSTQTIRNYNLHEALISYCFIKEGGDKTIQGKIIAGLRADCERMVAISSAEGYGSVLSTENWKQRHTIGNALQMAWELAMASELTGQQSFREVALRQLDFILGANPLGKVFITGIGSNPVRNPHYRPTSIKNQTPPGLLVKGPTHDPEFLLKIYKGSSPPPEKSYEDIVALHWCNEPDIEVQAHLIEMAAYFSAIIVSKH